MYLSEKYGLSCASVSSILVGDTWTHIPRIGKRFTHRQYAIQKASESEPHVGLLEAGRIGGISRCTMWRLVRDGFMPSVMINDVYAIPVSALHPAAVKAARVARNAKIRMESAQ